MKIQIPTAHPDTDLLLQMLRDKDVIIGDKEQEIAKLKASYQLLGTSNYCIDFNHLSQLRYY